MPVESYMLGFRGTGTGIGDRGFGATAASGSLLTGLPVIGFGLVMRTGPEMSIGPLVISSCFGVELTENRGAFCG